MTLAAWLPLLMGWRSFGLPSPTPTVTAALGFLAIPLAYAVFWLLIRVFVKRRTSN
jgi:hypothetical protein